EETLKKSEKKYRELFDSSLDGVFQSDAKGVFTSVNQAMARMLGHKTPQEVVGKPMSNYWADPKDRVRYVSELRRKKSVNDYPIRSKRKDGSEFYFEATCKILEDEKGVFLGIEGILRDITQRKKAEEELKKYSEDLKRSNSLKDLFIDIMRHDLINPVTVIKGRSDLAFREEENIEIKEIFQSIFESSDVILDMIENASLLAKLESEEKLELKEADLGIILRSTAEDNTSLADEKKTQITLHTDGVFNTLVNPLIYDVFSNLISNAIKYGPENSEVVVGIEDDGSNWKITVTNKGEGIPDEYKESIFDRFERIKKSGVVGTGLGLAIVKRVVKAHNGRVWVEDNPGGGSIFFVTLPKTKQ
ncbi:MAG: ATP-binding protein, partial [Candidatus Hydrothermarchaeales archaeon]